MPTTNTNLSKSTFSLVENQMNYVHLIIINIGFEIGVIECVFH